MKRGFTERVFLHPFSTFVVACLVISHGARAVDPVDFLESLKDDEDTSSKDQSFPTEYPNGVNVIPGEAEVNYPVYSSIPKSSFSCIGRPVGFYADTELRCQVWHICDEESRQQSFLCTNGTVYSQEKRVCDWWYNVNCDPNEVSRNYLQNYDLYKGPPPKSENVEQKENEQINNNRAENEYDFKASTKVTKDPFYNQPSRSSEAQQRFNNDERRYHSSTTTPSYDDEPRHESAPSFNNFQSTPRRQPPQTPPPTRPTPPPTRQTPPPTRQPATTTTTTTYRPPPPPAALQNNPFQSQQRPQQPQQPQRPPQQQQQPAKVQPSIQQKSNGGKRIVEIRVPISQIPPEILAKYGKRIPEHILKEIFLNFTRGQQQQLQQEALTSGKPSNPTGATGHTRSPAPTHPLPQSHQPAPTQRKPNNDFGGSAPKANPIPGNNNPPPPPPPEIQSKFRHSTPRKVDNVKFATPTRELLAEYEDERQQVGESQNPIYSLQQLFSSQHSRNNGKLKESFEVSKPPKEAFTFPSTTTTTVPPPPPPQQPAQEFTRAQPRRRTQNPNRTTPSTTSTTTEEPELITDRYYPVATKEEKKNADIKRIFLVARAGIKVLPPIAVLPTTEEPFARNPRKRVEETQRPSARSAASDFRVPPAPKVPIPDDYYVKNERFEEAESRYPGGPVGIPTSYTEPRTIQRPTTTATTTTTTTTTTTQTPVTYEEPNYKWNKPIKSQSKKKTLPQPPEPKKQESPDYDEDTSERVNTDELELLRLAQEYIELTGQDFGVRQQPRNA